MLLSETTRANSIINQFFHEIKINKHNTCPALISQEDDDSKL